MVSSGMRMRAKKRLAGSPSSFTNGAAITAQSAGNRPMHICRTLAPHGCLVMYLRLSWVLWSASRE